MLGILETIVVMAAVGCLASLCSAGEGTSALQSGQTVRFSLQNLDGSVTTNSELEGRVILLALGTRNSPLDKFLLPQLAALAEKYRGKPADIIWVPTDSAKSGTRGSATNEELRAFAQKYRFVGRILRDPDHTLDRQLGIAELPAILILDKQGRLSGPPRLGFDPEADITKELSARIEKFL